MPCPPGPWPVMLTSEDFAGMPWIPDELREHFAHWMGKPGLQGSQVGHSRFLLLTRGLRMAEHLSADRNPRTGLQRDGEVRRLLECLLTAKPSLWRCPVCPRVHVTWEGSCNRRSCLLCGERYGRERSLTYRDRLGPLDHLRYHVVTLPPEVGGVMIPGKETEYARKVEEAVLEFYFPLIPAGIVVIHWTGDEAPRDKHVHWNLVLSNRSYNQDTGEVVRDPKKTLPEEELRMFREMVGLRFGVAPERCNGKYSFRSGHVKVMHCLRYVLRAQGCGDDIARALYSVPMARHNRPIGMLARGKVATWAQVNPWRDPVQREAAMRTQVVDDIDGMVTSEDVRLCVDCGRATAKALFESASK